MAPAFGALMLLADISPCAMPRPNLALHSRVSGSPHLHHVPGGHVAPWGVLRGAASCAGSVGPVEQLIEGFLDGPFGKLHANATGVDLCDHGRAGAHGE